METIKEVTLARDPSMDVMDTVFKVADIISKLDPKDPHFKLKVANLVKGHVHYTKFSENEAALLRTWECKMPEDFQQFFKDRASGHYEMANNWLSARDNIKLKHHYEKALPLDAPLEAKAARKERYPECYAYAGECRCWYIDPSILED